MRVNYWDPGVELLKSSELKALQLRRLKFMIRYVYDHSPFYKRSFDERGFKPGDLTTLNDLTKLPFTTKEDLRLRSYPHGGDFLCIPREDIILWHMTSGTVGEPTIGAYTYKDYETWMNLAARCFVAAGVVKGDILMNLYGYGLFTGGLGLHQSASLAGAAIIPWGTGRTKMLVKSLKDFGVTVMTGTPSYQSYICEVIKESGMDPEKDLKLRVTLPGAEIWTESMRNRIEEGLALKSRGGGARNIYGATELCGPGAAQECVYEKGLHVWTDHLYLEMVDPKTLEPVEPGEEGEMVFTHLTRQGMPLIRYRMGDLTILDTEPCECGRVAFPRCKWIRGRVDDVIHYKGVKIYPSAVQQTLLKTGRIKEYQIVVDKTVSPYELTIRAELEGYPDEEFGGRLADDLWNTTFVKPKVELLAPGTLPRFEGKAKRLVIKE